MTSPSPATFSAPTAPVPLGPTHRRLWRTFWRRCACGLPAPCVDRRLPAPSMPFPQRPRARAAPPDSRSPHPAGREAGRDGRASTPSAPWRPKPTDRSAGRDGRASAPPAPWRPQLVGREAGQRDRSARPVPSAVAPPGHSPWSDHRLRSSVRPHPSPAASACESASRGASRRGIPFGHGGPRFPAPADYPRPAGPTPTGHDPVHGIATRHDPVRGISTGRGPMHGIATRHDPVRGNSTGLPGPSWRGGAADAGRAGWLTPAQEHRANGGRP